jgi:two-component system response regulator AtoC
MSNATVLVVDDEHLIRWSIGERLQAEGYGVLEADSGLSAIEQFDKGVDLVLLDSGLPDVDGIAVLRHLTKRNPNAHVILMTTDAGLETAVESMKLGTFPRANKPFLLDEIVALVRRTCAEVSPQRRGELPTA